MLLPNLDDRRWADLVEEARVLVPFYAPEWTDHNLHDPGITLIELLAWLAETNIYTLNRITETWRVKFFGLLGIHPRPPQPAYTVLRLALTQKDTTFDVPAETIFDGVDVDGESCAFTTRHPVTVVGSTLTELFGRTAEREIDLTPTWRSGRFVLPFGENPKPGAAFYLGFDSPLPPDTWISLWFITRQGTPERRGLIEREAAAQAALCRTPDSLVYCEDTPDISHNPSSYTAVHPSVRLVWECFYRGHWRAIRTEDFTRAFTLDGQVCLSLKHEMETQRLHPNATTSHYALRCRFVSGQYDAAPALRQITLNGVWAEQTLRVVGESVGTGLGRPGQRETLRHHYAIPDTLRVYSTLKDAHEPTEWTLRPDFDASGRVDRHFTLDINQSVLSFGDGETGQVVPAGAALHADYQYTRGQRGCARPGTIKHLQGHEDETTLSPDAITELNRAAELLVIHQEAAAEGGADPETLSDMSARALVELSQPARAVTLDDYERLAISTPAVILARAAAFAHQHPAFPGISAHGVAMVVIVPYLPVNRPLPSKATLRQVSRFLNRRALLGTRVEVAAPTYTHVRVTARVRLIHGVRESAGTASITAALNRFFHPLYGGVDGNGWQIGGDVYRSEVMQVIQSLPEVEVIEQLEMSADDGEASCLNICIGMTGLVYADTHNIVVTGGDLC